MSHAVRTAVLAASLGGLALAPASAADQPTESFACAMGALAAGANADVAADGAHALSMFGDVKYPAGFEHFDYADPDAPKGGEVRLLAIGTYDSLNPFILKGVAAVGSTSIYDTLLTGSADEPFTEYGLLVESIDMPADRTSVAFTLRDGARWHDGEPVTVDDVIWTFETLTTKGNPFFRQYYADVTAVEQTGARTVRFSFSDTTNRELPMIVGQLAILPKHYWEGREFDATTLEPPLGSGPYRIAAVDPGRSITYERVPDYWGQDLAVNRGQNNFDRMRYDYYRDTTVAIEAFKAGEFDFKLENNSKDWATAYDMAEIESGKVVMALIPHELPTGMQGFWYNTRRAKFADPRVRAALAYTFDFEWTNQNLFYGQYSRTASYFSNTELASSGLPEGRELAVLDCYQGRVPEAVFTAPYQPPSTDGSGTRRDNLRIAQQMLAEAGWQVQGGKLAGPDGQAMEIEFLLNQPAFERIVAPMVSNMKRLGIDARIRIVDPAQYQQRIEEFDFDVVVDSRGQSLSPGNEQRNQWTSAAADVAGSDNIAGIKDPVVDELVDLVIQAPSREALVTATRALDRVLLWGHYVIPNWHIRSFRIVYWNKFGQPETPPRYGLGFPATWWIDGDKARALQARR